MGKSLRLHPQYGVNPTCGVCYFCGEDSGEVILLGAAYKGEAPRRLCVNRNPCPKCKEFMRQGVILIEVRAVTQNGEEPERTGGFVVVTEDCIRRAISTPALCDNILRCRWAFVPSDAWTLLGLRDACANAKGGAA